MNYKFNKGFQQTFNHTFKNFSRSFFNSKSSFNMFNSSIHSNRTLIQFSNKFFMNKVYNFQNEGTVSNFTLVGSKFLTGEIKTISDLEKIETDLSSICLGDGNKILKDLLIVKHGNIHLLKQTENLWNTLIQLSAASRMQALITRTKPMLEGKI
jgi:hypothetical protein